MNLPSQNLYAFYTLAQELNFTNAAKVIGLSQPAFSQRIKSLESYLDTTLIIREKNNIRLTESGHKLLKFCKLQLQIENDLLSEIKGDISSGFNGEIRIGGFSSVMRSIVQPSLNQLILNNDNLDLNLLSKELYEIPSLLNSAKVDFIIYNKPITKEGIRCEFLGEESLVEIRGKKHSNIYLDQDEYDNTTLDFFKKFKKSKLTKRRYLDDIYSIYDAVKSGLGNAIMPRHLIVDNSVKIVNKKNILSSPVYLIFI